jgi:general stress protein YciG
MPKPVKKRGKPPAPPASTRPSASARVPSSFFEDHPERLRGTMAADQAIVDPETVIREHMSKIGAKGGKVSGAKRMKNLSERQRKGIARKAAAARWAKSKG